jgi:hypothetical protein
LLDALRWSTEYLLITVTSVSSLLRNRVHGRPRPGNAKAIRPEAGPGAIIGDKRDANLRLCLAGGNVYCRHEPAKTQCEYSRKRHHRD